VPYLLNLKETMDTVIITWKAFGAPTSATIEWDIDWLIEDRLSVCNQAFRDTNTYNGSLWNAIEPHLPPYRTHTALSIGDEVEVAGFTYRCDSIGWTLLERKENNGLLSN
jgi:hypothetical protein